MDQFAAFRETARRYLDWWENRASAHDFVRITILLPESLGPEHVRQMVSTVEFHQHPDTRSEPFSEAKLGRWLGWLQAAATAARALTLEECKEINRRYSETSDGPENVHLFPPSLDLP